jgi:phosphoribosylamine--glycine ligase
MVFHAGTRLKGGELVTAGGRVLGVTGFGVDRAEALSRAYRAADAIEFPGKQLRRDIGSRSNAPADLAMRAAPSGEGR